LGLSNSLNISGNFSDKLPSPFIYFISFFHTIMVYSRPLKDNDRQGSYLVAILKVFWDIMFHEDYIDRG
jgi:uncharacterized membrane protein YhaH (DUF805 family)